MEVNTRLQVEHLVSQCINHQIDLVELQIRVIFSIISIIHLRLLKVKQFPLLDYITIHHHHHHHQYLNYLQFINKHLVVLHMLWNVVFIMKILQSKIFLSILYRVISYLVKVNVIIRIMLLIHSIQ